MEIENPEVGQKSPVMLTRPAIGGEVNKSWTTHSASNNDNSIDLEHAKRNEDPVQVGSAFAAEFGYHHLTDVIGTLAVKRTRFTPNAFALVGFEHQSASAPELDIFYSPQPLRIFSFFGLRSQWRATGSELAGYAVFRKVIAGLDNVPSFTPQVPACRIVDVLT
jgi:hypothetical protein